MFATQAMAQTPAGAPPSAGGAQAMLVQFAPLVIIFILFYFLLIRPQQRRMKQQRELVLGVKRGDEVVLSSGVKGKVTKVDDADATVEIAPGVSVRVVKAMISDVRTRAEPAPANDLVK